MGKIVNEIAKRIIKSDLAVRKVFNIPTPKSEYFIDEKGIVRKKR